MFNYIKNMQAKGESVVGVKVTGREKEEMQKLIDAGVYLSFSDFLRSAIRDKLEEIKITKVKDVDRREAEKEIMGYYMKYKEAYPSDVADDLELDYDLVFELTEELRKEGRLE
jgi:Arc/MetJ-type ribon-helix-helix transcriptional regulator